MGHGMVEVAAFQEALLIEAVFGIALLAMIWAGFRRWIHHKEQMGRLSAEESAERAAEYRAHIERVEAQLKVLEQMVGARAAPAIAPVDGTATRPLAGPASDSDEA